MAVGPDCKMEVEESKAAVMSEHNGIMERSIISALWAAKKLSISTPKSIANNLR